MSSRINRFKNRQEIRKKNKAKAFISGVVDQTKVDKLLDAGVNAEKMKGFNYTTDLSYPLEVNPAEVENLLFELRNSFNKERQNQFFDQTKKDIIFSIAGPFGLGKVLSAYDKEGGNITTVHNANKGVYAKDEDKYKREDYTHTKNSEGKQFANAGKSSVGSTFTVSKMDENKMVQDAYTGKIQKASTTSPDHIESLSQHHKNGGFMQTSNEKADFATDEENLAITDRSINQSMRDFDKECWADKQTKEGTSNKEKFETDGKRLKKQIKRGKKASEKHLPSNLEKAEYYIISSTVTGLNEGAKMGAQQAFGVLLIELFSSSFTEIRKAFEEGLEGDTLYQDIKNRLKRIGKNLSTKWKGIIQGFSGGFITGFVSNLITTFINMFVTTAKRMVRMIREGVFSLLKALKLIVFPPKNMTYREVMHEAMKLVAAGGVVIAGVALEEVVDKLVLGVPFLVPFTPVVSAVIVGVLTAICMALVTYLIDKMDLLGIIEKQQNEYISNSLDTKKKESLESCNNIYKEIKAFA